MSSRKYQKHLLLACLVLGGIALSPADAAANETPRSLIVAQGTGEVRVRPDSVRVDVGVEAQAATLDEARSQVGGAMGHVLDALHGLGVPDLTIETREIQFSPVYGAPNGNHPPSIVGYSASNHVLVTSTHAPQDELAARSAHIVDAALAAGANSVGAVEFFLADATQAEDQALTLAVQNAESDAHTMARAANVTIVGPVWIEEASATRVPRALALVAATVSTPIEIGDIPIQVSVTAKFTFQ
jgi:uncharacterized protein YggE